MRAGQLRFFSALGVTTLQAAEECSTCMGWRSLCRPGAVQRPCLVQSEVDGAGPTDCGLGVSRVINSRGKRRFVGESHPGTQKWAISGKS